MEFSTKKLICICQEKDSSYIWTHEIQNNNNHTCLEVSDDKALMKLTNPSDGVEPLPVKFDPVRILGNDERDFWRISDILWHTTKTAAKQLYKITYKTNWFGSSISYKGRSNY